MALFKVLLGVLWFQGVQGIFSAEKGEICFQLVSFFSTQQGIQFCSNLVDHSPRVNSVLLFVFIEGMKKV